ncbi:YolD-like family protein [Metasolibacillus sp. FSL H7-0170]|uniref:YolD-like family protein n=1 Tax=Metasolibacillus sp. FSL H7-0170 TaxID=2921431 RepID=UPI003158379C
MLRDRGNKKWSAMMLSEHMEMLRNLDKEQMKEYPLERAEWELEHLQQTVQYALQTKAIICLILWRGSSFHEVIGVITAHQQEMQELVVTTSTQTKRIAISSLYSAQLMDEYDDSLQ